MRLEYIHREQIRRTARLGEPSPGAFLQSLGIQIRVAINDPKIYRASPRYQNERTSFNLTNRRYTKDEVARLFADMPGNAVRIYVFHVRDKSGDDGRSGLVVARRNVQGRWILDAFCLSCLSLTEVLKTPCWRL